MIRITLSILLIINFASKAQEKIFLVSGTPFYYKLHYPERKPLIFSFDKENQSLDTVLHLSTAEDNFLSFLKLYPEFDLLVTYEESLHPEYRQVLSYVTLDSAPALRRKELNFKSVGSRESWLVKFSPDSIFYLMHFGGLGYFSFNKNLEQKNLPVTALQYAYLNGSQGIATDITGSILPLDSDFDSTIKVRMYNGDAVVKLLDAPPPQLKKATGTLGYFDALKINTDKIKAIIANNSVPNANEIGTIGYLIKNNEKSEWFYQEFKGGRSGVVAFDDWLVGFVEDYNMGTYYLKKGQPIRYDFKKVSPGLGDRLPLFPNPDDEAKWNGESENFEERAAWFGSYYPGILFAFNTLTKQYIEWRTDQGDSEIILLDGNRLYYRINDELFEGEISGNRLINVKLLMKNDRMRDVHWAYILH